MKLKLSLHISQNFGSILNQDTLKWSKNDRNMPNLSKKSRLKIIQKLTNMPHCGLQKLLWQIVTVVGHTFLAFTIQVVKFYYFTAALEWRVALS